MTLDFEHQLANKIRSYKLPYTYRVTTGIPRDTDSVTIASLPGGRTINGYMDGTEEKELHHEIVIKTKNKQREAIDVLTFITQTLEGEQDIQSENGSFDYDGTRIVNAPFLQGFDAQQNFVYTSQVASILTTYRKRDVD